MSERRHECRKLQELRLRTLLHEHGSGCMEAGLGTAASQTTSDGASSDPRGRLALSAGAADLPACQSLLGAEEEPCRTPWETVRVHISPDGVAELSDAFSGSVVSLDELLEREVESASATGLKARLRRFFWAHLVTRAEPTRYLAPALGRRRERNRE